MKIKLFILLSIMLGWNIYQTKAQETKCLSDKMWESMLADNPAILTELQNNQWHKLMQENNAGRVEVEPITISVVFHVLHRPNEAIGEGITSQEAG